MKRDSINTEITGAEQAKRSLLFFLLALFLITTCPIKKSISMVLFDNAGIENFGLNDQKTVNENERLVSADPGACSTLESVTSATVDLQSLKVPLPLFPISLAFIFLLPASYLHAILRPRVAVYSEELAFAATLTPIYIRNRRLLI